MAEVKTMNLNTIDVYRLLIGEVRYGCSRNNNLMPGSAFDEARQYVPVMFEADPDLAVHTAAQLCTEVINELALRFWEGAEDEFGNRQKYLDFINWCLDFVHQHGVENYVPYNNDQLSHVLATDDLKQFIIMDNETQELLVDKDHALSRREYMEYILKEILKAKEGDECRYNFQNIKADRDKIIGHVLSFVEPFKRSLVVMRIQ